MNVNFEYCKTLAIEGSILLWLSVVPYVGWVLGIIGVILLLRSMKEFSGYYQDEKIYTNALAGVKYYVVAIIAAAVATATAVGIWIATGFMFNASELTSSFVMMFLPGLAALAVGAIVAFVFFLLASIRLKETFRTLAAKTGEGSFSTAASLLWIGSILTIIGIGLVLILVAWIFATIGFATMKNPNYQPYTAPQNGYTPTPQATTT
jgi:uncharacterized membrane protein